MVEINIAHQHYTEAMSKIITALGDIHEVHCQIEFWADHSQSKIIRDFVGKIFDVHHVHALWRGRFILITDELINNAIEHGSAEDDIDSCVIHAGKGDNGLFQISLEVHDTGNGKDSWNVKNIIKIKENAKAGYGIYMGKRWRGLFHITEKLVDKLSFSESPKGGLAVKVEKTL